VIRILFALLVGRLVTTDANAVLSKWKSRTSAAQSDYVSGIETTTKDPVSAAIANQARLKTNFNQAVDTGKWANNLRAVGKAGWVRLSVAKANNFSNGVNNADEAFLAGFGPLLQFENSLQQQIDSMPNVTDTDRENRMLAWVRGMRQYSGR
jgi:hypothetical protein